MSARGGHRVVQGLMWAFPRERGPWGPSRARGAKAQGKRYERALAHALPGALHGQWFEFFDRNGRGWCQPDVLVRLTGEGLLVLEAKYTWVPEGHSQIDQLYKPVLERVTGLQVLGLVVCKVLVPGMKAEVFGDLALAVRAAAEGRRAVLHWIGSGPLTAGAADGPRQGALPATAPRANVGQTLEELGL